MAIKKGVLCLFLVCGIPLTGYGIVLGIDVSVYQGVVDWNQVAGAGQKVFAVMRATAGKNTTDSRFAQNIVGAHNAGVVAGTYHFAYPEYFTPHEEAQKFLSVAGAYIGAGYLPPVLDVESSPSEDSYPSRMGSAALSQWIRDWCAEVEAVAGIKPIIYCNRYYAQNFFEQNLNQFLLWIATDDGDPSGNPGNIGIWSSWAFQQYCLGGSGCTCPGVSGTLDLDSYNGDLAALLTLTQRPGLTGTLTVQITPAEIHNDARWRVDGGGWQVSGATVTLTAGSHTVAFNDDAGYDKPNDAGVTITAGQDTSLTGNYVRHLGSLRVEIPNADARAAGAAWRRVGTATWLNGGETETGIPTDSYTVEFKGIGGVWITPSNQAVTITKNAATVITGLYNRPPVLPVLSNAFVHALSALEYSFTATDADGDALALRMDGAPDGAVFTSFLGDGFLRFAPSPAQAGQSYAVTFTVSDALGATDQGEMAIQVGSPPTVASLADAVVVLSNTASFTVGASDPENDPKTFAMSGAPQGATLTGTGDTRQFSYTAAQRDAGKTFSIVFTATDADGPGSTSMSLRVKSPPVFWPVDSLRVVKTNLLVLSVAATDPDGDAMSFSVSNAPPSSSFTPHSGGGVFSYFPPVAHAGQTFSVQFRVVDVDGLRTMAVPITVVGSAQELTLFGSHRDIVNGFGGRMESATYVAETAGAQGQPIGLSQGGNGFNFAGFLLPMEPVQTSTWEIVATTGAGGTIAPSGTVMVANGSNQPFTIAADEYYAISNVVVDGVSIGGTNAYEFMNVVSNGTIHAVFAELRTPQGVPYGWLASYGLTNQPWEEAAALDQGCGRPAWEAWVAGTDPTNPATAFRVDTADLVAGRAQVALRTVPGRLYTFWCATNLVAPVWRRADYSLTTAGSPSSETLSATSSQTVIYLPLGTDTFYYIRPTVQRSAP